MKHLKYFENTDIDPFDEEDWDEGDLTPNDKKSLSVIKNFITIEEDYYINSVEIGIKNDKPAYCNFLYKTVNQETGEEYLVINVLYNGRDNHLYGIEYNSDQISNFNGLIKSGVFLDGIGRLDVVYDDMLQRIEKSVIDDYDYNEKIKEYNKIHSKLKSRIGRLSWEEKKNMKLITHVLYSSIYGSTFSPFMKDYISMNELGEKKWNDKHGR